MKRILIFVVCLIALTALAINYPSSSFFGTSVQNQTTAGGVCTAIGAVQTVNHGSEFAVNGFPAGLTTIGSQNGMDPATDASVLWQFLGSTTGHAKAGDGGLYTLTWSSNRFNSGSQVGVVVMGIDASGNATPIDPVGAAIAHVPYNRTGGLIPGWCMFVQNPTTNNQGFAFCATSLGPDSDNYSALMIDHISKAVRIPFIQQGLCQPTDKIYAFTVTGVTTQPHLGDMYSNSAGIFTAQNGNGNSLSGGAGTLAFSGKTDPAASGALVRIGINSGNPTPDASISFSTWSITARWKDTFYADPITGRISLTNGYIAPAVLYTNMNGTNVNFNGEYANTSTFILTNAANAGLRLSDPVTHNGQTVIVKALGGTTLGMNIANGGTFGDGALVTGFSTVTPTFMAFSARMVQFTAANGQWWVVSNVAN